MPFLLDAALAWMMFTAVTLNTQDDSVTGLMIHTAGVTGRGDSVQKSGSNHRACIRDIHTGLWN